jgi:large subunit ribosomal protein L4e
MADDKAPKKDEKKKAPTKAKKPEEAKKAPAPEKQKPAPEKQDAAPAPAPRKATPRRAVHKHAGATVNVYSLDGKVEKSIELPGVFNTNYRPDVIRRAVKSAQANRRQAYGPAPRAGMRHVVSWPGKGRGMARTPRLNHGGGRGAEVPNTPGGRRAHPPRPEKDWTEKINKKEKALALHSAIAAVGRADLVRARGHRVVDGMTLPLIVSDDFESLFDSIAKDYKSEGKRPAFTKEAVKVLEALGLSSEMARARDGIHQRSGRGKMRGRRFKCPTSILFVVKDTEKAGKCLANLPGVDVISPSKLNVELLAPGGDAGRLTVFTEAALKSLGGE